MKPQKGRRTLENLLSFAEGCYNGDIDSEEVLFCFAPSSDEEDIQCHRILDGHPALPPMRLWDNLWSSENNEMGVNVADRSKSQGASGGTAAASSSSSTSLGASRDDIGSSRRSSISDSGELHTGDPGDPERSIGNNTCASTSDSSPSKRARNGTFSSKGLGDVMITTTSPIKINDDTVEQTEGELLPLQPRPASIQDYRPLPNAAPCPTSALQIRPPLILIPFHDSQLSSGSSYPESSSQDFMYSTGGDSSSSSSSSSSGSSERPPVSLDGRANGSSSALAETSGDGDDTRKMFVERQYLSAVDTSVDAATTTTIAAATRITSSRDSCRPSLTDESHSVAATVLAASSSSSIGNSPMPGLSAPAIAQVSSSSTKRRRSSRALEATEGGTNDNKKADSSSRKKTKKQQQEQQQQQQQWESKEEDNNSNNNNGNMELSQYNDFVYGDGDEECSEDSSSIIIPVTMPGKEERQQEEEQESARELHSYNGHPQSLNKPEGGTVLRRKNGKGGGCSASGTSHCSDSDYGVGTNVTDGDRNGNDHTVNSDTVDHGRLLPPGIANEPPAAAAAAISVEEPEESELELPKAWPSRISLRMHVFSQQSLPTSLDDLHRPPNYNTSDSAAATSCNAATSAGAATTGATTEAPAAQAAVAVMPVTVSVPVVVYWMNSTFRVHDNYSLDAACWLASKIRGIVVAVSTVEEDSYGDLLAQQASSTARSSVNSRTNSSLYQTPDPTTVRSVAAAGHGSSSYANAKSSLIRKSLCRFSMLENMHRLLAERNIPLVCLREKPIGPLHGDSVSTTNQLIHPTSETLLAFLNRLSSRHGEDHYGITANEGAASSSSSITPSSATVREAAGTATANGRTVVEEEEDDSIGSAHSGGSYCHRTPPYTVSIAAVIADDTGHPITHHICSSLAQHKLPLLQPLPPTLPHSRSSIPPSIVPVSVPLRPVIPAVVIGVDSDDILPAGLRDRVIPDEDLPDHFDAACRRLLLLASPSSSSASSYEKDESKDGNDGAAARPAEMVTSSCGPGSVINNNLLHRQWIEQQLSSIENSIDWSIVKTILEKLRGQPQKIQQLPSSSTASWKWKRVSLENLGEISALQQLQFLADKLRGEAPSSSSSSSTLTSYPAHTQQPTNLTVGATTAATKDHHQPQQQQRQKQQQQQQKQQEDYPDRISSWEADACGIGAVYELSELVAAGLLSVECIVRKLLLATTEGCSTTSATASEIKTEDDNDNDSYSQDDAGGCYFYHHHQDLHPRQSSILTTTTTSKSAANAGLSSDSRTDTTSSHAMMIWPRVRGFLIDFIRSRNLCRSGTMTGLLKIQYTAQHHRPTGAIGKTPMREPSSSLLSSWNGIGSTHSKRGDWTVSWMALLHGSHLPTNKNMMTSITTVQGHVLSRHAGIFDALRKLTASFAARPTTRALDNYYDAEAEPYMNYSLTLGYPAHLCTGKTTDDELFSAIQLALIHRAVQPAGLLGEYWMSYWLTRLATPELGLRMAIIEVCTHTLRNAEDCSVLVPAVIALARTVIHRVDTVNNNTCSLPSSSSVSSSSSSMMQSAATSCCSSGDSIPPTAMTKQQKQQHPLLAVIRAELDDVYGSISVSRFISYMTALAAEVDEAAIR